MSRDTLGKLVLGAIVVGVAAILYVVFSAASNEADDAGLERFRTASLEKLQISEDGPAWPDTRFFNADGAEVTLSDWRGKTVLVNLWATWCAPCVKEMPTLATLQKAYADQPFEVIAVSVDAEAERESAKAELAKLTGGTLPFFHDFTYGIAYATKSVGFPTTILYGPDGREIARIAGEADWSSPEARGLIEAALERNAGIRPAGAAAKPAKTPTPTPTPSNQG